MNACTGPEVTRIPQLLTLTALFSAPTHILSFQKVNLSSGNVFLPPERKITSTMYTIFTLKEYRTLFPPCSHICAIE